MLPVTDACSVSSRLPNTRSREAMFPRFFCERLYFQGLSLRLACLDPSQVRPVDLPSSLPCLNSIFFLLPRCLLEHCHVLCVFVHRRIKPSILLLFTYCHTGIAALSFPSSQPSRLHRPSAQCVGDHWPSTMTPVLAHQPHPYLSK